MFLSGLRKKHRDVTNDAEHWPRTVVHCSENTKQHKQRTLPSQRHDFTSHPGVRICTGSPNVFQPSPVCRTRGAHNLLQLTLPLHLQLQARIFIGCLHIYTAVHFDLLFQRSSWNPEPIRGGAAECERLLLLLLLLPLLLLLLLLLSPPRFAPLAPQWAWQAPVTWNFSSERFQTSLSVCEEQPITAAELSPAWFNVQEGQQGNALSRTDNVLN